MEQVTEKMPYTVLKAYLLNTIKKYVSDNETKNNCSLWKKFFSSEEFEQFYFESDFRRKASDIIYCETFTPETASVIASGFGRGTRAIPLKSDPLNQWRVDISNCEGKKSPKVEPLVPDYAQSYIYRDMTLKDLIFLIAVLIILMFIAALYSSYHADKAYYRPSQQQTTVVEQSGPPYIYTDELGNLHIADQPPER